MVPGVPGKSGPHVPRPVVKELQKESGAVPLLFQPMVEQIARGNLPRLRSVTNTNVSLWMVSGAPGEAGQSVPRAVVEELKKG